MPPPGNQSKFPKAAKIGCGILTALAILAAVAMCSAAIGSTAPPQPLPPTTYTPIPTPDPTPTAAYDVQPAPAAAAGPLTTFTDVETLAVGTDIEPGTYTTRGAPGGMLTANCYYEIHSQPEGTFDSLVKNGNIGEKARGRVTLKKGQYFSSMGGCEWTKAG
jgi:hypothetical protein